MVSESIIGDCQLRQRLIRPRSRINPRLRMRLGLKTHMQAQNMDTSMDTNMILTPSERFLMNDGHRSTTEVPEELAGRASLQGASAVMAANEALVGGRRRLRFWYKGSSQHARKKTCSDGLDGGSCRPSKNKKIIYATTTTMTMSTIT